MYNVMYVTYVVMCGGISHEQWNFEMNGKANGVCVSVVSCFYYEPAVY